MKKSVWAIALAAALGATLHDQPAHAGANGYTEFIEITQFENLSGGYRIGAWVNDSPTSINDPAGCVNANGIVFIYYDIRVATVPSVEDREIIGRTLLSAFLAGRKVKLYVHGTSCNGIRPYYYGVLLDKAQ